mmetsp:Transcript_32030/g.91331  ORF Transcript_32030/g.91331 Transcript_32030/m.91331 type:complete len:269 (+) Transcript_32030:260-1066(+)
MARRRAPRGWRGDVWGGAASQRVRPCDASSYAPRVCVRAGAAGRVSGSAASALTAAARPRAAAAAPGGRSNWLRRGFDPLSVLTVIKKLAKQEEVLELMPCRSQPFMQGILRGEVGLGGLGRAPAGTLGDVRDEARPPSQRLREVPRVRGHGGGGGVVRDAARRCHGLQLAPQLAEHLGVVLAEVALQVRPSVQHRLQAEDLILDLRDAGALDLLGSRRGDALAVARVVGVAPPAPRPPQPHAGELRHGVHDDVQDVRGARAPQHKHQ